MVSTDTADSGEVICPVSLIGTLHNLYELQNINMWDGFPLFVPEFSWGKRQRSHPPPQNHVLYWNGVMLLSRMLSVVFVALFPQGVNEFNHLIILGKNVFLF